jgi:hypothetical protein
VTSLFLTCCQGKSLAWVFLAYTVNYTLSEIRTAGCERHAGSTLQKWNRAQERTNDRRRSAMWEEPGKVSGWCDSRRGMSGSWRSSTMPRHTAPSGPSRGLTPCIRSYQTMSRHTSDHSSLSSPQSTPQIQSNYFTSFLCLLIDVNVPHNHAKSMPLTIMAG